MSRICPHCNLNFNHLSGRSFGAHLTNCSMNPKKNEIRNKISKSNTHDKFNWILVCNKCGSIYTLKLTNKIFSNGNHSKYCNDCRVKRNKIPNEKYGIKNIDVTKKYNVNLKCSKCNCLFNKTLSGYTITRTNFKPICNSCISKSLVRNRKYEERSNSKRKELVWKEQDKKCNHCGFNKYDITTGPYNLHHIDGNYKNRSRLNEEVICCNCHYMTYNYGFKGRKHTLESKEKISNKSRE